MLIELLSEKNRVINLKKYEKSAKTFLTSRLLHIVLMLLLVGMAFYVTKELKILALVPVAAVVGYKLPYYNLLAYHEKRNRLNRQLFPEFLVTFIALLPTSGNVYQTLVAALPYTKDPLRSSLEKLITKIEDNNNREDYLEFAETVGTSESFMLMDMMFQFSEYGIKKESFTEMQRFSQELDKNIMAELIDQKINGMESLGLAPVFIALFFIISFAGVIGWHYLSGVSGIISM